MKTIIWSYIILFLVVTIQGTGKIEKYKNKKVWDPTIEPWTTWKHGAVWNMIYLKDVTPAAELKKIAAAAAKAQEAAKP